MKILVTNDDGIHARGIQVLAKELLKDHEVIVVAPKEQKSASSHSISIHNPLRVREEKIEGLDCKCYSVLGTPADCTQIGISFLGDGIDYVISGINKGYNTGTDVLYSGTVSAAVEGAIYDIPSMAVSLEVDMNRDDEDYTVAAKYVTKVLNIAKEKYLKENVVLNLNIPKCEECDIKGIKICRIGKSTYKQEYTLIENGDDMVYSLKGVRNNKIEEDSDMYYLSQGYVTLTPLHYDLTSFSIMKEVQEIFE
ncbi:MAG: 5'/3'-nucleotidase SurE [Clostridium sp.]